MATQRPLPSGWPMPLSCCISSSRTDTCVATLVMRRTSWLRLCRSPSGNECVNSLQQPGCPAARWSFVFIDFFYLLSAFISLFVTFYLFISSFFIWALFLPNILYFKKNVTFQEYGVYFSQCYCIDVLLMFVYVLCRSLVDCMQAELSTSLPMFLEDRDDVNEEEGSTAHVSTSLTMSWMDGWSQIQVLVLQFFKVGINFLFCMLSFETRNVYNCYRFSLKG